MKKTLISGLALLALTACVGYVDGKAKNGKTTHDVYLLHPAITISGYTSQL